MASFILLLHRSSDYSRPLAANPSDYTAITREYMEWADRTRAEGHLKAGNKLTDEAGRILKSQSGRVSTTDGPYAESKEVVAGFFMISAGDYAEACRIAESCPHLKYGSHIEVRQVQEL
jgi:hypothetical protein